MILNQRVFWMIVLVTLALKGAGELLVDYLMINHN